MLFVSKTKIEKWKWNRKSIRYFDGFYQVCDFSTSFLLFDYTGSAIKYIVCNFTQRSIVSENVRASRSSNSIRVYFAVIFCVFVLFIDVYKNMCENFVVNSGIFSGICKKKPPVFCLKRNLCLDVYTAFFIPQLVKSWDNEKLCAWIKHLFRPVSIP